jgi:hypothetical protein
VKEPLLRDLLGLLDFDHPYSHDVMEPRAQCARAGRRHRPGGGGGGSKRHGATPGSRRASRHRHGRASSQALSSDGGGGKPRSAPSGGTRAAAKSFGGGGGGAAAAAAAAAGAAGAGASSGGDGQESDRVPPMARFAGFELLFPFSAKVDALATQMAMPSASSSQRAHKGGHHGRSAAPRGATGTGSQGDLIRQIVDEVRCHGSFSGPRNGAGGGMEKGARPRLGAYESR